jgi:hypothetical protein
MGGNGGGGRPPEADKRGILCSGGVQSVFPAYSFSSCCCEAPSPVDRSIALSLHCEGNWGYGAPLCVQRPATRRFLHPASDW